MGAFELRIDSIALLIGYATALALGLLGSLPPALRVMRLPIVDGLKAL
jgi:putative ABC transport system permease protein